MAYGKHLVLDSLLELLFREHFLHGLQCNPDGTRETGRAITTTNLVFQLVLLLDLSLTLLLLQLLPLQYLRHKRQRLDVERRPGLALAFFFRYSHRRNRSVSEWLRGCALNKEGGRFAANRASYLSSLLFFCFFSLF